MQSNSGLTLIEILISMAIVLVVTSGIVIFQSDLFSVNSFLEEGLSIQNNAEALIQGIVSELRTAAQSDTGGYPIQIAASTSIAFYSNINKDAYKERIQYFMKGTTMWKSVVSPAGNPLTYATTTATEILLPMLTNIVLGSTTTLFAYYDASYAGTTTPLAQPLNIASVRLVGITLTVDSDPLKLPPPITVSSQVVIRNLKDNL